MGKKIIKFIESHKNYLIWVFIIVVFVFLLRATTFDSVFERDEGEYAYAAWMLSNGKRLYVDNFLQKPPLIVNIYQIAQFMFGNNVWGVRILAYISLTLSSLVILFVPRRNNDNTPNVMGAFVFMLITSSPYLAAMAANTEVFMLLPLTLVIYIYFYISNNKLSGKKYNLLLVLFGVFCAISLFIKPICLYLIIYLAIRLIFRNPKKISSIIKSSLSMFLGVSVICIYVLIGLILFGSITGFYEQAISFNALYAKFWGFGFAFLFRNLKAIFESFWVVYLMIFASLFVKFEKKLDLIIMLVLSFFAVFQTPIKHYYLLMAPSISLLIGFSYLELTEKLKLQKLSNLMVFGICLFMLYPIKPIYLQSGEVNSLFIYGYQNPFIEAKYISEVVGENTASKDCIFVAGSEPEIYYYSQRISCTKFVITYPLNIISELSGKYQHIAVAELEANPPKAIIITKTDESGFTAPDAPKILSNYIDDLLKSNYKLLGGFEIDDKTNFIETSSLRDIINPSLLLYKKI